VVTAFTVKNSLLNKKLDIQAFLYTLLGNQEKVSLQKLGITLQSSKGSIVLFEDEVSLPIGLEMEKSIFDGENLEVIIDLRDGNYGAVAYGAF